MNAHLRTKKVPIKTVALLSEAQTFYQRGDLPQALEHCAQVLQQHPRDFAALHLAGVLAHELKLYTIAVDFLEKALCINPSDAQAHNNLGLVLCHLTEVEAALAHFQRAITLKPNLAKAHADMGTAWAMLREFEQAVQCYGRAIELQPGAAQLYAYRGLFLDEIGAYGDATHHFEQAVRLDVGLANAHWNRSLHCLRLGAYAEGWVEYEWRWRRVGAEPLLNTLNRPLWLGVESLEGKTILIHCEQGFGDTFQFCRYLTAVRALGATVLFVVPTSLRSVLKDLDGVDVFLSNGDALPDYDYITPLMSLPLAFGTESVSIPAPRGYIRACSDHVAKWQPRLGPKTAPRIGLVWRGSAHHGNDGARSINLAELAQKLPIGPHYVSLQKEMTGADRMALLARPDILDVGEWLDDFSDTAAVCALMDVVISVDTSVAHLAGALSCPVWVLLPFNPDWRWLLGRQDSPWYPSARLYRQGLRDVWLDPLERLHMDLAKFMESKPKVLEISPDN